MGYVVPVRAYGEGDDVMYEYSNGWRERWSGGTRAWRNQNPGNVRFVAANNWQGQIGEAGGFCVFADRESGERAVKIILEKYGRDGLTLGEAIARYAPASENDVTAYVQAVQAVARVGAGIRLATLDRGAMDRVLAGVFRHEGWRVGVMRRVRG